MSIEYRVALADNEVHWVHERAHRLNDANGVPQRVDGIVREFRDGAPARTAGPPGADPGPARRRQCGLHAHQGEGELLKEFCRIAVARGGFVLARVVELDRSGKLSIAATRPRTRRARSPRWSMDTTATPGAPVPARALRSKQPMVSNDMKNDERVPDRATLTRSGNYSLVILPVCGKTGSSPPRSCVPGS